MNGTTSARFAFDACAKAANSCRSACSAARLSLPLPLMAIRALTVQGSYVGNPKELRELVALAQNGNLQPLPVTDRAAADANDALMRLRDGRVTGRLVLKSEAA